MVFILTSEIKRKTQDPLNAAARKNRLLRGHFVGSTFIKAASDI